MNSHRRGLVGTLGMLACFFLSAIQPTFAAEPQLQVVVHPSVTTQELSVIQLRKIFSKRQTRWPDGLALQVFVLNSKDQNHQTFCKTYLKMFPYQLDQVWNKLTYSGLGDPPVQVSSMEEMMEKVSQTPGAIGYMFEDMQSDGIDTISVSKG